MNDRVMGGAGVNDRDLTRKFEGILSKFTNLVKGYQPRIFHLDPDTGYLSYYLLDDSGRRDKLRGSQTLGGSICTPSEEDENTFHINFASGEQWKVRAISAKERQQWVNRIRACAYHESVVNNHIRESKPVTPPGSRSHFTNGEPSKELQTLSLSVRDAFGSVHTCLNNLEREHKCISDQIEGLPARKPPGSGTGAAPTCHDKNLLQLKATSAATLRCVEDALSILQELKGTELGPPVVYHHATIPLPTAFNQTSVNLTLPGSPAHRSVSSLSIPTTPSRGSGGRPKSADIMKITSQ